MLEIGRTSYHRNPRSTYKHSGANTLIMFHCYCIRYITLYVENLLRLYYYREKSMMVASSDGGLTTTLDFLPIFIGIFSH